MGLSRWAHLVENGNGNEAMGYSTAVTRFHFPPFQINSIQQANITLGHGKLYLYVLDSIQYPTHSPRNSSTN